MRKHQCQLELQGTRTIHASHQYAKDEPWHAWSSIRQLRNSRRCHRERWHQCEGETVDLPSSIRIRNHRPIGGEGWQEVSILSVLKKTVVNPVAEEELVGTIWVGIPRQCRWRDHPDCQGQQWYSYSSRWPWECAWGSRTAAGRGRSC